MNREGDHGGRTERRTRVLRQGSLQVLWALLLVYFVLAGIALLFGPEVGYGISFGVCLGIAALVTAAFLAIHLLDRATAASPRWVRKLRELRKRRERHSP